MTNDEHWHRHSAAVQRRILGHVMFGIRLHTMTGPPIETRIQMLEQRIAELKAVAAGADLASAIPDAGKPAEKQPDLPWNGASKEQGATDGAQEGQ